MGNQYEWAEALRKAKQGEKQKQPKLSFSSQSKITVEQLEEQMEYYKNKLREAVRNNNKSEIQNMIDRMITCHSRITALLIKNEKDLGEADNSPTISAHLQKYFSDCAKLLHTFSS
ncbi:MAG: hypothetical protein A3B90_01800 [Candidatus Magasanikbacteria bacterium RIFCSPHIGHO2_02_FULL_41_13]|uniref:Uncharacterized protein n=1 Tax=Candidatus Magasanikbacteria bacterium RIFCSPHIGHO2_02_FULL_41_13 TaxID=1798676 RepID=A0A1F6M5K4_9BACT|nr:MAG: hypothetical protein A3B90_01800 [Candidatus Magasanikbacteria bacterium RIFCSPHIGHO2_02_FULL_41_13]